MSDPHLTPDELTAENDLICEKLLGWTREPGNRYTSGLPYWREHDSIRTPSFTTWAEAGLILEALGRCAEFPRIGQRPSDLNWYCALKGGVATVRETGPLTVRAAAIEYIQAVKS